MVWQYSSRFTLGFGVRDKGDAIKIIRFSEDFNDRLEPGDLPIGLKTLIFGMHCNQPLQASVIPTSRSHYAPPFIHSPLQVGSFPDTITSLTFGQYYNLALQPNVLPSGLTSLTFVGRYFNQVLAP
eukprot:gene18049-21547_t